MIDFFQQYPHAKLYYRVGERNFLSHCQREAELYALQNQMVLETITPDYQEPEDEIKSEEKNNTPPKRGKSKNKNKS